MPDAHFTVPYPEHTHFVGREDDLARLHAALQGEGPVGINPAAMGNPTGVTGQGGIGKTQLAVAYAYRYRPHYPDGVYWLNAAESLWSEFANLGRHFLGQGGEGALKTRLYETLRTRLKVGEIRDLCFELGINYEEFSPQLGLSSLARELVAHCERRGQLALLEAAVRRLRGELAEPQAQDELVALAFARLREQPQSLLILDNLADPAALDEALTRDCVPGRLTNRLLFTTRRRDLGRFRPVELKTLPPDAALRLLLRDPRRQPVLDPAHREHTTARDICAMFGYLPLALEIAAAHLAKKRTRSLADYRQELRARGALDVVADPRVDVKTRHEAGLEAALTAQWAALSDEAQLLLRVAGQLPEAAYVPAARLGLLAGIADESSSFFTVTLGDALLELDDGSMIEELAGEQVRLHPLVREFAHDQTPLVEKAAFHAECARRLLDALGDIETLERQCDARGIDALIHDLLVTEKLLNESNALDILRDLRVHLRVLRQEAHNLRGWRRVEAPAFLAQQLALRVVDSETPTLFGDLSFHMRSFGSAWLPRWLARNEPPHFGMKRTGKKGRVNAVAVSPNGQWIVSGGGDGLRIWNLATGQHEQRLTHPGVRVNAVAVTPDGRQVVYGGTDGLRIWSLDTGEYVRTQAEYEGRINAVSVMPNGRQVVYGGMDEKVHVWKLDWGRNVKKLGGYEGEVRAVAALQDGQRAIIGTATGMLHIANLATGWSRRTLPGHKHQVNSVAVTPDGRRAVSGGADKILFVWNLDTDENMWTLPGHRSWISAVAVMPDGQRAISGGADGTLRMWDLNTGRELARAILDTSVRCVAIAPGQPPLVIAGDAAGNVYCLEWVE